MSACAGLPHPPLPPTEFRGWKVQKRAEICADKKTKQPKQALPLNYLLPLKQERVSALSETTPDGLDELVTSLQRFSLLQKSKHLADGTHGRLCLQC